MSEAKNPCDTCDQGCPADGCAAWRRWWVDNWNENICRCAPQAPKQVWQYEHPDRVREMEDLKIPGTVGTEG